jgi:hypothetical protein
MLANALWIALYGFLIFWSLEAAYVIWQAYFNDGLPGFRNRRHAKAPRLSPRR